MPHELVNETELLLDDQFAPLTSEIGFIELAADAVSAAFETWQSGNESKRGVSVSRRPLTGGLEDCLRSLLPLTSVERKRALFVPTNSAWTAYFDNGYRGTDAFPPMSYLARTLRCRTLRVTAVPNTIKSNTGNAPGRYGALVFALYGANPGYFLNTQRSISLMNDGGTWRFDAGGEAFSFERSAKYKAKKMIERLSVADLVEYMRALGVDGFARSFYAPGPNNPAYLIEKSGPLAPEMKKFQLDEVRRDFAVP